MFFLCLSVIFSSFFLRGLFFRSGREGRFSVKKRTGNKNKTWNALMLCPLYAKKRNVLFNKLSLNNLPEKDIFLKLMSAKDNIISSSFSRYITECLDLRNNVKIYDVLKHLQANVEGGQCSLSIVTMHWYRLDKRKKEKKKHSCYKF